MVYFGACWMVTMVKRRAKGARGERDARDLCRQHGYDCHRSAQRSGARGQADLDINANPPLHVEVKYTESFRLWSAIDQAIDDAQEGAMPVVFYRKNGKPWVTIMLAEDFLTKLVKPDEGANQ